MEIEELVIPDDDVFWGDIVGDKWESEGVDPGRIWEGSIAIPGYDSEVMVQTCDKTTPGVAPRRLDSVRQIALRRPDGKVVFYTSKMREFRDQWRQVSGSLC